MDSGQIADMVALILANGSSYGPPLLDWNDSAVGRGRHDRRIPAATIAFHDGMSLFVGAAHNATTRRAIKVTSRDGHVEEYEHGDMVILRSWSEAQAMAILQDVGERIPDAPEPVPSRRWFRRRHVQVEPDSRAVLHLARTISQWILDREPTRSEGAFHVSLPTFNSSDPPRNVEWQSDWNDVGYGLRIMRSGEFIGSWIDDDRYMVAHDLWGVVCVPAAPILDALRRRRDASFASSMPPCGQNVLQFGNRQADALRSVGRGLLSMDADLRSPGGSRIDALVERHLPRLMSAHADAVRSNPGDRAVLDDRLGHGLDVIRNVLDQSLDGQGDEARHAFLAEVRFLEMRHPEAVTSPDRDE